MPLTVLVKVPGDSAPAVTSEQGLADIGRSRSRSRRCPTSRPSGAWSTRLGEGKVSDLLRPSVQLRRQRPAFRKPPSADLNVQLGDASLAGVSRPPATSAGWAAFPACRPRTSRPPKRGPGDSRPGSRRPASRRSSRTSSTRSPAQLQAAAARHRRLRRRTRRRSSPRSSPISMSWAWLSRPSSRCRPISRPRSAAAALAAGSDPVGLAQLLGSIQTSRPGSRPSPRRSTSRRPRSRRAPKCRRRSRRWPPPGPGCPASSTPGRGLRPDRSVRAAGPARGLRFRRRHGGPPLRHDRRPTRTTRSRSTTVRDLRALLATDPGHFGRGAWRLRSGAAAAPQGVRRRSDRRVRRRPGHHLGRLPACRRDHDHRHPDRADPAAPGWWRRSTSSSRCCCPTR
jgi:hypothetical protein